MWGCARGAGARGAGGSGSRRREGTARHVISWWTIGLAGGGVGLGWIGLLRAGWIHQPYSGLSKAIAWRLGFPEQAYNFGVVEPGRLWRASRPDAEFVRYLRDRYGLERVISLNGSKGNTFHHALPALGIELLERKWSNNRVPDADQLDEVLGLMREPVRTLVHCGAGKDRTGFAVACYRIAEQGWLLEHAVTEMRRHWHKPHRRPWFVDALRRFAAASARQRETVRDRNG